MYKVAEAVKVEHKNLADVLLAKIDRELARCEQRIFELDIEDDDLNESISSLADIGRAAISIVQEMTEQANVISAKLTQITIDFRKDSDRVKQVIEESC